MNLYQVYTYISYFKKRIRGIFYNYILTNELSFRKKIIIGKGFKIVKESRSDIQLGNEIVIGENVEIRVYNDSYLTLGNAVKLDDGVRIISANSNIVQIGENSKVGYYSVLNGGGGITIGKNCSTYGFVYFQSSSHKKNEKGYSKSKFNHNKIVVQNNCLIGPHQTIVPGTVLSEGTILTKF